MLRIRRILPVLLSLLLLPPAALEAQDGWDVSISGGVGYLWSVRTMAKNTGELEEQQNFQVLADLEDTPTAVVAVEAGREGSRLTFRGRYMTTLDGRIGMIAAVCNAFPETTNPTCTPFGIDVTLRSFLADVRYLRGNPGDLVRPILSIGGGIRSWSFGPLFSCGGVDSVDFRNTVCPRGQDIVTEVSSSPALILGFGLRSELGPVSVTLSGEPTISSYNGGVGNASGNTMIDVAASLTGSVRIF